MFIKTKVNRQHKQHNRTKYRRDPSPRTLIWACHKKNIKIETVLNKERTENISRKDRSCNCVIQAFVHSQILKSLSVFMPKNYKYHVEHCKKPDTRTCDCAYKERLLPTLKKNDKSRQNDFLVSLVERISKNETFLTPVCYSDEATFYVSRQLNTQYENLRIRTTPCD